LCEVKGYTKSEIDFTEDYQLLIMDWLEFLSRPLAPSKRMSLAYQIIEREMRRHNSDLKNNNTKRTITIYEKIN
jgi:hypothetical protein